MLNSLCNVDQEQITHFVTKGVINSFEIVEVDEQRPYRASVDLCPFQRLRETNQNLRPVRQSGQEVMSGLVSQGFLDCCAFRDVMECKYHASNMHIGK